jgi:hypothetical protein
MKKASLTSPQSPHNGEVALEENAAESLPHAALSHRLAAPLLKYLECRGQLLSLEGREAMQHAIYLDARLAIGDLSLLRSWVFLTTALVGALTYFFDSSPVAHVSRQTNAPFATRSGFVQRSEAAHPVDARRCRRDGEIHHASAHQIGSHALCDGLSLQKGDKGKPGSSPI